LHESVTYRDDQVNMVKNPVDLGQVFRWSRRLELADILSLASVYVSISSPTKKPDN
jgi:hypothetical protein